MSYINKMYFLLSIYLKDNLFLRLQSSSKILGNVNIKEEKSRWSLI